MDKREWRGRGGAKERGEGRKKKKRKSQRRGYRVGGGGEKKRSVDELVDG
jgi:hypothetical protein